MIYIYILNNYYNSIYFSVTTHKYLMKFKMRKKNKQVRRIISILCWVFYRFHSLYSQDWLITLLNTMLIIWIKYEAINSIETNDWIYFINSHLCMYCNNFLKWVNVSKTRNFLDCLGNCKIVFTHTHTHILY